MTIGTWTLSILVAVVTLLGPAPVARGTADLPVCPPWILSKGMLPFWFSPAYAQDWTVFTIGTNDTGIAALRSTDGGRTWTGTPLPGGFYELALSPFYPTDHTLFAGGHLQGQVLRSTDSGRTWTPAPSVPFPGDDAQTFASYTLVVTDAHSVYVASAAGRPGAEADRGLSFSEDGGATWRQLVRGRVDVVAVSPDFSQDHTLLIGMSSYHYNAGVFKSTDSGMTWVEARKGIDWGENSSTDGMSAINFSPGYAQDRTVFAAGSKLYKTTDAGAFWTTLPVSGGPPIISPYYSNDQTLWMSEYAGGTEELLISTDGGATWRALPTTVTPTAAAEHCPPGGTCGVELFGYILRYDPNIIGGTRYRYKSYDYGQTWQCLEDPAPPPAPTPSPPPEVPEPATFILLAGGVAGLIGYLRIRRGQKTI